MRAFERPVLAQTVSKFSKRSLRGMADCRADAKEEAWAVSIVAR